jgi:hypothetical protein
MEFGVGLLGMRECLGDEYPRPAAARLERALRQPESQDRLDQALLRAVVEVRHHMAPGLVRLGGPRWTRSRSRPHWLPLTGVVIYPRDDIRPQEGTSDARVTAPPDRRLGDSSVPIRRGL